MLLSTVYDELDNAADNMDFDALQEIFDEMDGYSFPEDEEELWQKLKSAAQEYDYEGIRTLLKSKL